MMRGCKILTSVAVALLVCMSALDLSFAADRRPTSQKKGFVGVWWGEVDEVLAGVPFPFITTFHSDGTYIARNSVDELSERPFSLTSDQGVWQKTGPSSARSVSLRFVKDPATGNVTGFERIRLTFQLVDDDHISGTFSIEVFECVKASPASAPHCPNPTDDITGFFPPIVQNVPYTATRVKLLKPAGNDDNDD
jgi:hypothetical protein